MKPRIPEHLSRLVHDALIIHRGDSFDPGGLVNCAICGANGKHTPLQEWVVKRLSPTKENGVVWVGFVYVCSQCEILPARMILLEATK